MLCVQCWSGSEALRGCWNSSLALRGVWDVHHANRARLDNASMRNRVSRLEYRGGYQVVDVALFTDCGGSRPC